MNSLTKVKLFLVISFCLLSLNLVKSQDLPGDFKVVATAGGMMPGSEVSALYIQPDGTTTFTRYISNDPASDPLDYQQFTLTSAQLGQIWQAIQDNGFFSLEKEYINLSIFDGTYASLTVTANSTTHTVWTKNIGMPAFDNIINKINSITLPQYKLSYDISVPPAIEQVDVCDRSEGKSTYHYSKPSRENPQPIVLIKPKSAKDGSTFAHPGTSVAYEMSLQDAVNNGFADVSSKGEYWGDDVCITGDYWKPYTAPKVKNEIFIEFFGEASNPDNAQRIEDAIENIWSNRTTSDGKQFDVDVITRVSDSEIPPMTAGYHQIELVADDKMRSKVNTGTDFGLNSGVAGGKWRTTGSGLNNMYAHEGGHLMGLPEQYDEYVKQYDDVWERKEDKEIFSSEQLTNMYNSDYGMSEADFKTFLDAPTTSTIAPPKLTHENDIMGGRNGVPLQSDIDQIASKAGLGIDIEPGDIIVDKDLFEQNLTITREEHLFLLPGETKKLPGLYGACIDLNKHIPSSGDLFDVAPNLKYWTNYKAAGYLHQLLVYINENDFYCSNNFDYQELIWRITDNCFNYDRLLDTNLINAGINIGDRMLDFPRLSNPFNYKDVCFYIVPEQLYTLEFYATPGFIVDHPQNITVDAKVSVFIWDDYDVNDFHWILEKPEGSASQLSAVTGSSVNFTPDIRGIYKLKVEADFTDLMNQDTSLTANKIIIFADKYVETFESGNLSSSPPFAWQTSDTLGWKITDDYVNSGTYSLCSGAIGNGEKSEISLNITAAENDSIYFTFKTSSEDYGDFLRFYLDDVPVLWWSGDSRWMIATLPVSKGNHQLKWTYEKDGSYSMGGDRCWIDDIFLPNFTITHISENNSIDNYKVIAFPNPVEQYLTLRYIVESKQRITVCLYDINGKLIRLLNEEIKEPGVQTETYNLTGLSNGTYIIKIKNNENAVGSSVLFIKE